MDWSDLGDFITELVGEAKDHLATIEPDLLELEKKGDAVDDELLNRLFRAVHSIKGGFNFLDIKPVGNLTHVMESVLIRLRDRKLSATPELVDCFFAAVDKLSIMVNDIESIDTIPIDKEILDLKPFEKMTADEQAKLAKKGDSKKTAKKTSKNKNVAKEKSKLSASDEKPKPAATAVETPTAKVQDEPEENLAEGKDEDGEVAIKTSVASESLRVRVSVLNRLMNLAGEMVLARNQLSSTVTGKGGQLQTMKDGIGRMEQSISRVAGVLELKAGGSASRDFIEAQLQVIMDEYQKIILRPLEDDPVLKSVMAQVDFLTSEMQENIMSTRLQPLGVVFGSIPRMVRDLGRTLGKSIEVEISGDEVELDKSIIETISDPLVHLIRNCCDHGIETAEEREKENKPSTGLIEVRAVHDGDRVMVEIVDDGRGLNPTKIKNRAIEKGLITRQEADVMPNSRLQSLIMAPGFSTADVVSEVSGRGVGMDVVKANIESLGGTIDITSSMGMGMTIRMHLPVTMAIIHAFLLRAGGLLFAMPQSSIEEFVRVRKRDIATKVESLGDSSVIRRRGRLLPLVHLADVLGIPRMFNFGKTLPGGTVAKDKENIEPDAMMIVVLKVGDYRYGLVVKEIFDYEEVVIKPVSSYLKRSNCYSGMTILSDGGVSMMLDSAGIADEAGLRFENLGDQEHEKSAASEADSSHNILLFKNGTNETFAININLVSRIDKIAVSEIITLGGKEYLNKKNKTTPVLRLENYLPIAKPEEDLDHYFFIEPKYSRFPLGFLATELLDVYESSEAMDTDVVAGAGVLGTGMINDTLTLFIDVFDLHDRFHPEDDLDSSNEKYLSDFRILLAEDSPFFQQVVKKFLSGVGADVVGVDNGQHAWELLNSGEKFDLLLTDVMMPDVSGLELIKRVRRDQRLKEFPCIIISMLATDADVEQGMSVGADRYLIKLDKDELLKSIAEVLGVEVNA